MIIGIFLQKAVLILILIYFHFVDPYKVKLTLKA